MRTSCSLPTYPPDHFCDVFSGFITKSVSESKTIMFNHMFLKVPHHWLPGNSIKVNSSVQLH